jgi:GTP-binding protein EngB required for normal cell division
MKLGKANEQLGPDPSLVERLLNLRKHKPVVVMLGNCGVGKSSLVETLTGRTGLSSKSKSSHTKCSLAYPTDDLLVVDTPGKNALGKEKLEHNLYIAQAFSFRKISLILLCVEAHCRLEDIVGSLTDPLTRFCDFADILCPCITKMDGVAGREWTDQELLTKLEDEFGVSKAVFSGFGRRDIKSQILTQASKDSMDIEVTSDDFLRYFPMGNNNLKITTKIKAEVDRFENITRLFQEQISGYVDAERVDLVFEFQAWMKKEIERAQTRVAESCGFQFYGANEAMEYGHIANLTNQLKNVLYNVRVYALSFQNSHGVSNLRKCPHCGLIWTKIAGCDGQTTCGNKVGLIDSRWSDMATFSFEFTGAKFLISKVGVRAISVQSSSVKGVGCGKTIVWSDMASVPVPGDFKESEKAISTEDVAQLSQAQSIKWDTTFQEKMAKLDQESELS